MKKVLKKLLIAVLIMLILNNFFMSNSVNAADSGYEVDDIFDIFENILSGIVGILTWPLRIVALAAGWIIKKFSAIIAFSEGATDLGSTSTITPYDIFFNRVKLLDINFFEIGTEANFINSMRTSVASWYYVMRILASVILLVILIYVGIRMAISTVASDRAMYQKMLVDWVASLALIFVLQYIIIFTITANNAIVNVIGTSVNSTNMEDTYDAIFDMGKKILDINSIAATIIYCMLVWQTLGLVFAYFSRMLKIAFLIIIAPLITLTYSIDKMGDGKAQALNTWLKEFVFTILMQPFHCIMYMCLVDTAFNLLKSSSDAVEKLARSIVAILMIRFIKEGEKIVRKIFAFKDDNSKTSVAAGMATAALAVNQAKNLGKNTRKAVTGAKNFSKQVSNLGRNAHVEAVALARMISHKNGEDKTFSQRKEEVRTEINNKKADKIAERSSKIQYLFNKRSEYRVASMASLEKRARSIQWEGKLRGEQIPIEQAMKQARREQFADEVDKEKERIIQENNGAISDEEAESMARVNVAKDHTIRGKAINGAKGKIDKVKTALHQSYVLRELGDLGRVSATAGLGLMIGSGVYGTGGNLATAIGAGSAVYRGTQEYFKSSGRTLSSGINNNLKDMGIENHVEARAALDEVSFNEEKYNGDFTGGTKAEEELGKQLKALNKELDNAAAFDNFEVDVKNVLQTSPEEAPEKISDLIDDFEQEHGVKFSNDARKGLTDYANKTAIQYQLAQSEDIGIDKSTMINDIALGFVSPYNRKYEEIVNQSEEIVSKMTKPDEVKDKKDEDDKEKSDDTMTVKEFEEKKIDIDVDMSKLTDSQLEKVSDAYDRRIKEKEDELRVLRLSAIDRTQEEENKINQDRERIKEEIEKLELEQADVIGRALSDSSRKIDKINNNLYREYQAKLDKQVIELNNKIKEKQIEIDKKVAGNEEIVLGIKDKSIQKQGIELEVMKKQLERLQFTQNKLSE